MAYSAQFSSDGRYVVTSSNNSTARITPLGFDGADLHADQILAMITLIRLAPDKRNNQALQITLHQDGWVYTTFQQLPDSIKNRLQDQFPEIRDLTNQAVEGIQS